MTSRHFIYRNPKIKNTVPVHKWLWGNGVAKRKCNGMELNPYLILYTKNYLKMLRGINVRGKTIKVLEENIDVSFYQL
jgi:hypothetical protein